MSYPYGQALACGARSVHAVPTRRRKVSITIPADLLDYAKQRSAGRGVSAVITDALRNEQESEQQERLESALILDAEASLSIARAAGPLNAALVKNLEW